MTQKAQKMTKHANNAKHANDAKHAKREKIFLGFHW